MFFSVARCAFSDLEIELLNYDEELLAYSIPVKDFEGEVSGITPLTHDIRLLEITIDKPLKFWAGQYVDITLPDQAITRSFSMANPPSETEKLAFIIKRYEGGAFSGQLDGGLAVGTKRPSSDGPYGTCLRREGRGRTADPGGWRLGHVARSGRFFRIMWRAARSRPVRFFYGAQVRSGSLSTSIRSRRSVKSSEDFEVHPSTLRPRRGCRLERRARLHPRGAARAHQSVTSIWTTRATPTPAGRRQ